MSQPIILKVYGNLCPVAACLYAQITVLAQDAMPYDEACPPVILEDDLLRISFEGIYFPTEEILAAIAAALTPAMQGKLDELDLEAWTLIRHVIANGEISAYSAPLNNVMAYSGH